MTDDDEDETGQPVNFSTLMRAMEAAATLAPVLGSTVAAKIELADRLRDGRVVAFSRRAWKSGKRDVLRAWEEEPDPEVKRYAVEYDFEVASAVWRRSVRWIDDQASWRWPSGRFSVAHHPVKGARRIMLENVHFDPAQIAQIGAELAGGASLDPQTLPIGDGGVDTRDDDAGLSRKSVNRHIRGKAWAGIMLETIRLFQNRELDTEKFDTKAKLADYLAKRTRGAGAVGDLPLQSVTVYPFAALIYDVLRDGKPFNRIPEHDFHSTAAIDQLGGTD